MSKDAEDFKKMESHLNRIANYIVVEGGPGVLEWMDKNGDKDPYMCMCSLIAALLTQIPKAKLVENSHWSEDAVGEMMSLLLAGVQASLTPRDSGLSMEEAVDAILEGLIKGGAKDNREGQGVAPNVEGSSTTN
jgi:hypothetical protein